MKPPACESPMYLKGRRWRRWCGPRLVAVARRGRGGISGREGGGGGGGLGAPAAVGLALEDRLEGRLERHRVACWSKVEDPRLWGGLRRAAEATASFQAAQAALRGAYERSEPLDSPGRQVGRCPQTGWRPFSTSWASASAPLQNVKNREQSRFIAVSQPYAGAWHAVPPDHTKATQLATPLWTSAMQQDSVRV